MEDKTPVYYYYRCIRCGKKFAADGSHYRCDDPQCNGLLMVERDEERIDWHVGRGKEAQNYFDAIRYGKNRGEYPNGSGVFMWLPHLLPGFPGEDAISLREGHTDLFEVPDWFKKEIGMKNLYIKLEGTEAKIAAESNGSIAESKIATDNVRVGDKPPCIMQVSEKYFSDFLAIAPDVVPLRIESWNRKHAILRALKLESGLIEYFMAQVNVEM